MLYPDNFEQKISFTEIRSILADHCISPLGRDCVAQMSFSTDVRQINGQLRQVEEYGRILSVATTMPEQDFFDLRPAVQRIRIEGTNLDVKEIWELYRSLRTLHSWLELVRVEDDGRPRYPSLNRLSEGVFSFYSVCRAVERLLDKYGHVRDDASPALARIRGELRSSEGRVSNVLHQILRRAQADGLVDKDLAPTLRDGRLVIPVAPAMKRQIPGIIHDESASGRTVFIEPVQVVEANNRIRELESEEKREVLRLFQEFTSSVRPNVKELLRAFDFLGKIEFVRAKHGLKEVIHGICPKVRPESMMDWVQARHPLLELSLRAQGKKVVPLEIQLESHHRILIISGPNAGGKSVCLKTVGLLQYMVQCGLPVPLGEASRMGVFSHMFIDIGDEQSIENDLSTYSSHLLNMKNMMRHADGRSLLLIDEFGSGTEPTIGGAIAQAILMQYVDSGAFGVITTHYQNIKEYAAKTEGIVNGAMLYDRQRMEALYQLETGNPGSSFALEIARKTGIPEAVIQEATHLVGQDYVNADKYLLDIIRDKRYWEGKRATIHQREKQMEQTIHRYEEEIAELQRKRKEIVQEARQEAERIIEDSNRVVESTIREIRVAQAEKQRTREVRQELEDFKTALGEQDVLAREDAINRKMKQIEERRARKAERRKKADEDRKNAENRAVAVLQEEIRPLTEGDSVRIKGQTTGGTIESIEQDRALVTFGMMRMWVETARLERLPATRSQTSERKAGKGKVDMARLMESQKGKGSNTADIKRERALHFNRELDVRGMRGDEALQAVTYYVDDAVMLGVDQVRILHGTGNGILRQLIRQYLRTLSFVSSARDEHVQFGGAGITVVTFGY